MSADGGDMGDQKIMGTKKKTGLGVFACCCCCQDDSNSEEKEHEVVIPKPRGCTDSVYLILYITFCCIMILIAVFALVYGNPLRLINGMDSFGNVCGSSNENFAGLTMSGKDMSDKPYVFFFNLRDMDRSTKICVSQCPGTRISSMEELAAYQQNTSVNLCRYDVNASNFENPSNSNTGESKQLVADIAGLLCPRFPIYSSRPVLKRCIPRLTDGIGITVSFLEIYEYLNSLNIVNQILGDLAVTWVSVLVFTACSFVISFIIIGLLQCLTSLISCVIMVVAALLCVGFTGFMWWTYVSIKITLDNTDRSMMLDEMVRNESAFLVYSIMSTVFTVLLICIVLYLRKRVNVVVQLFREAGSALCAMPCLVIQPFITYISLSLFFCAWLYIVLCLATADQPRSREISMLAQDEAELSILNLTTTEPEVVRAPISERSIADESPEALVDLQAQNRSVRLGDLSSLRLIEYTDGVWVKYLWWIYIIGLVWCSEFILACQQMVIASSVAAWYFSRKRSELRCMIMESISRLVKYHLGSVALGSLLITLVKVPRLVLKFADRVLRKWENYKWAQWLSRCCQCCLGCFENCMRYIHHNAYTVIAIQGVGFCPATRLAFSALVQNALQISVINSIGDAVLFLAKCIAALLTGLIALVYFQHDERLYFYAIPVLLTIVFSYFVAHCVISVFEMAVDTLFLCFCEDHNMHADATDGQQFYAPPSLLRYMTTDAVDAVNPGRRSSVAQMNDGAASKIAQISQSDRQSYPEETIPMNPYAPTTERIED